MVVQVRRVQLQRRRAVLPLGDHVIALAEAVRIGASVLCGKLQRFVAKTGVAVRDDFIEKLQGALALPAGRFSQIGLPAFRHLAEEAGMLYRAGLPAEDGNVLCPVADLVVALVAAGEVSDLLVVVEELNVVVEDLCLDDLTGQNRRDAVLVRINRGEAGLVHGDAGIAEDRKRMAGQRQKLLLLLFPQLLDGNLVDVVQTLGIILAPLPEMALVELLKGGNRGNRNKGVPAAVADLVLHVALLVAGGGIAKLRLEAVVHHEPGEAVGQNTVVAVQHLGDGGAHVVKAQMQRNAANALKDPLHALQQTLLVLRGEGQRVTLVGIREGNRQSIARLLLPGGVVVHELPEVHLAAALGVVQRKVTAGLRSHGKLLFADVLLYAGVAATETVFFDQPVKDALRGVALLSGDLAVLLQPLVNDEKIIPQYRITLWLEIRQALLTPVVAVGVLLDRAEVFFCQSCDF